MRESEIFLALDASKNTRFTACTHPTSLKSAAAELNTGKTLNLKHLGKIAWHFLEVALNSICK